MSESNKIVLAKITKDLETYFAQYDNINNEMGEIEKEQREKTKKIESLKRQLLEIRKKIFKKLVACACIITGISFALLALLSSPIVLIIGLVIAIIPILSFDNPIS